MSDFENAINNAKRLAGTPEGKQLAALLQQLGGTDLQQAMDHAAAGDFRSAQQALSTLMKDPQARQIIEKMGGKHGA